MTDKKQLTFVYEHSRNHTTVAVNGAFGGPSPGGTEVVAHLYLESWALPSLTQTPIDKDGKIDVENEERTSRGDIARIVQTTLTLTPEAAISVGNWLIDHGTKAAAKRQSK
ncbi:MAG: hypothetical protein ACC655_03865 [Rhodothermia bacterium]